MSEPTAGQAAAPPPLKSRASFDLATGGGLLLAFCGILGGLVLEGGSLRDVAQVTAGMIVLGGTLGAVMVTTPVPILLAAARKLPSVFVQRSVPFGAAIDQLVGFATQARRDGIISLEAQADRIEDAFLKRALNLAVDGTDAREIRETMELEIHLAQEQGQAEAKVFESAGGYSPTIGIIGAVLGLIQVMKNLANIDEVGRGIAVAFVATVYGVGVANLFFLPAANKLKARLQESIRMKEMTLDGVIWMAEGLNPKLIRSKLEVYQPAAPAAGAAKGKKAPERAPEAVEA